MARNVWWRAAVLAAVVAGPAAAQDRLERPSSRPFREEQKVRTFARGVSIEDPGSAVKTRSNIDAVYKTVGYRVGELLDPEARDPKKPRLPFVFTDEVREKVAEVERLFLVRPSEVDKGRGISPAYRQYIKHFGDAMVAHLSAKDVQRSSHLIVRVNALRLLALVGKSGYEPLADVLLKKMDAKALADGKVSQLEALFALQGLRFLLNEKSPEIRRVSPTETAIRDKARFEKVVKALVEFAERPLAAGENPAAYRVLRREAVRALAGVPKDTLRDLNGRPIARPGHLLLRVAAGDVRLAVPPGQLERLEALTGFVGMDPDKASDIDYGVFWANWSLLQLINLRQDRYSTADWKREGGELLDALAKWPGRVGEVKSAKQSLVAQRAAAMAEAVRPLKDQGGPQARFGAQANAARNRMANWAGAAPASKSLYTDQDRKIVVRATGAVKN